MLHNFAIRNNVPNIENADIDEDNEDEGGDQRGDLNGLRYRDQFCDRFF